MELFPHQPKFDFLGKRWFFLILSALLVGFALWGWVKTGDSKWGIDFAGGTDVEVSFKEPVAIAAVREAVEKAGFSGAVVQEFQGSTFSIRVRAGQDAKSGDKIVEALRAIENNTVNLLKEDYVGPVIGEQIRRDGIKAFVFSLIAILIYLKVRFDFAFAAGAVAAVAHDAIIACGFYVLYGYEVSAALLAAVLTVIGFSVNDTVVIFDRIRENLTAAYKAEGDKKKGKREKEENDLSGMSMAEIMNVSLNQTLSRTVLTSATAFFASIMLWRFGGGSLAELGFAFSIGCIVGTYSSVYIACPVVLLVDQFFAKKA